MSKVHTEQLFAEFQYKLVWSKST